jgi:hypothetical protein
MSETNTVMMPRKLSDDDLKKVFSGKFYQTVKLGPEGEIDVRISIDSIKSVYAKCVEHFGT